MASVFLLAALYVLSLASELICNSRPLCARSGGRTFFPAFGYVSEDDLVGNGVATAPDYRRFCHEHPEVRMVFAPFRFGPRDIADSADLADFRRIRAVYRPEVKAGRIDVRADLSIAKSDNLGQFADPGITSVTNVVGLTPELADAIAARFANVPSPALTVTLPLVGGGMVDLSLLGYEGRESPPRTVRIRMRDAESAQVKPATVWFDRCEDMTVAVTGASRPLFNSLDESVRRDMASMAKAIVTGEPLHESGSVTATLEPVTWPFRPVKGHPMGIDNAGRDVFARVLYGTRTAMTFGLVLVAWALAIGIVAGAMQGYFGGWVDLGGQRFIEIWSALPFLYVMILVGSVFGRSFGLLLFCYGLFNWIGISYYVRAEFLRLRSRPFVEAAKCQGLGTWRIILRHMLPNALTPLITLLPFNLVGAIASISALDFLGFGLPPLTPSWGELLSQAQQNTSAWWLILYPSVMLFATMLLSVFIGEGLRDGFDPKPQSRYS